jgi:hypothetical protein
MSQMIGVFPVSTSGMQSALPDGLRPVEITPGVAAIILMAMSAHIIDGLYPYNSFGVFLPVKEAHQELVLEEAGYYCHHLFVTGEDALEAGAGIWGLPPEMADISFEEAGDVRICRVREDGREVLTLEAERLDTTAQVWNSNLYSVKGNYILKTNLACRGQRGIDYNHGRSHCTLDYRSVAEELRDWEMGSTSIIHYCIPQAQMILPLANDGIPLHQPDKFFNRQSVRFV